MMNECDVVVIEAGHNGLTCAAYLARAGLKVRVVERRPIVGGAAVTEEFHPGFRNSVAAYTVGLLHPTVIRDLNLYGHGLRIADRRAMNSSDFRTFFASLVEKDRTHGGHLHYAVWPLMICPSRIVIHWFARSATSRACVTTTIVLPSWFSSSNSDINESAVLLSRAPVGSSAKIKTGSLTRARAIATRCCSPPESWLGQCCARWDKPTRSSAARARRRCSESPTRA